MAKRIKVLKCPQCGHSKPETIGKEHYRCSKCGTEFFLDSDDVNINVNHRYEYRGQESGRSSRKGIWVVLFFIVILSVFFLLRLCSVRTTPVTPPSVTVVPPVSQKKSNTCLFSTIFPVDGKVVSFTVESKRSADSVYIVFRDVTSGNLLGKRTLGLAKNIRNEIAYRWFKSDSTHYLIRNKNTIYKIQPEVFDLEDITGEICSRKPALEPGIMTAEFVRPHNGEGFKLHTNLGKDLYYFPSPDILCTEKAFRYMVTDKPLKAARPEVYYLFRNK